ncbi:efflux RND transporter permease subunit [Sulfuricurvum sp. RIFCSPLOWO2_12_FULL_43_24]|uniref:efflux RND transporter permease subunit n=1 Tax=Sulfuricurvum sp. RIFCSPLOWO2_12_FULL_43_24 TaxID=1802247 RepID=UPI0008B3235C|nr:efflux RND transporter permease subunit [Sulfuricurvum sp. RIFCSPLOWO2_12_FULL_43_24]OHD88550.1 MAG: acriflavin resistance protein [Sulfuricurvum sp. RIFCSPLOWO2_12_FULL_43_24]
MYKFAINRPITTLMLVMTLVVFGMISFRSMPVALFPNIDFPIVTIQTAYPGADPESVESKVTDKIEEAVSGVDGIDKLISTSYEGLSVVTVQFELTKDIEEAANDVRDKIGTLNLDAEVESPSVQKVSASGAASIKLFISTKTGDPIALMRFADEQIKPKLQRIQGVAKIDIVGYRDREIRIFTDPFLLNKYAISSETLQSRITAENVRAGGGKLISNSNEFILKTRADASSIEQLKSIVITPGVRLSDIARVEDGLKDVKSYSSFNGHEGVLLEVQKIAGTNDLEVISGVKKTIPSLKVLAGNSYDLELVEDQSQKILINIENVKFDLIYGSILAVLIVFFFLRNLTATIISALAIPTSIIGTFAMIDVLGYDLNRLTLIGLTLAIGIFIDDAIVVIENISKKIEHGMEPLEASFAGVKEISFSILAISSMLLAVFVPVAFMGGIVGKFFNSFAMTVASGVLISYFVAIMFIPTIGARLLSGGESKFWQKTEPIFLKLDLFYRAILTRLLRFKWITVIGVLAVLIFSFSLAGKVGGTFVPMEDMSEMRVMIKAPVGISLEAMKKEIAPMVKTMQEDKRIETLVLSIGYNAAEEAHKAMIYAKLLPVGQREGLESLIQSYREKFQSYTHFTISVEDVPPIDTGESNAPIQVVLTGPDLKTLESKSLALVKLLKDSDGVIDIDTDFEPGKPEVRIGVNRESAQRLGISAQEIARAIGSTYSSDSAISNFEQNGRQFDITLRTGDEYRSLMKDLKKMQIQTASGEQVMLDGLVTLETTEGAASINRFDRERKILVTANLNGAPLDSIVSMIDEKLPPILGEGYQYRYTGDIERMQETAEAFGFTVLLAVVLIYLILAALYESLIQPFIIMVAMPLSFTGVILALFLTGNPFSIFVMIGIILLMGMVGKNAILVVDFANNAIKEGKNVDEALLEAGEKRLRPILMTTFAMIFAMLPLALGGGAGHESNAPMAIAVIGGLISSTLLALFIVPVLYRLMYPMDSRLRTFYERRNLS